MTTCERCGGEGLVSRSIPSYGKKRRGVEFKEWCPDCQGTGTVSAVPIASTEIPKPKKARKHGRKR